MAFAACVFQQTTRLWLKIEYRWSAVKINICNKLLNMYRFKSPCTSLAALILHEMDNKGFHSLPVEMFISIFKVKVVIIDDMMSHRYRCQLHNTDEGHSPVSSTKMTSDGMVSYSTSNLRFHWSMVPIRARPLLYNYLKNKCWAINIMMTVEYGWKSEGLYLYCSSKTFCCSVLADHSRRAYLLLGSLRSWNSAAELRFQQKLNSWLLF